MLLYCIRAVSSKRLRVLPQKVQHGQTEQIFYCHYLANRTLWLTKVSCCCCFSVPNKRYCISLGPRPQWCSWCAPRRLRVQCGRGQRRGGFKSAPCQRQSRVPGRSGPLGASTSCLEFVLQRSPDWQPGCHLGDRVHGWTTLRWDSKRYPPRRLQGKVRGTAWIRVIYATLGLKTRPRDE